MDYEAGDATLETPDRKAYRENWTAGGFVMTTFSVPVFLALLVAPSFVLGVAIGVTTPKLVEIAAKVIASWRAERDASRSPSTGLRAP